MVSQKPYKMETVYVVETMRDVKTKFLRVLRVLNKLASMFAIECLLTFLDPFGMSKSEGTIEQ